MNEFWNRNYRTTLKAVAALSATLALASVHQVSAGNFAGFEPLLYWFGLPYGAYIWGDLLVFSILWTFISLALLKLKNSRLFWIALFSFWLVRSSGEALYWFIQQFHPQEIPWPQYFTRVWILKSITQKEYWVLNQIGHQSVVVASLFGLIYQVSRLLKEKG
jgi:hypothetical protein